MKTTCTSLQTDNHTNTSSLDIYVPDSLPKAKPTASEHCWILTSASNLTLLNKLLQFKKSLW